MKKTIKFVTCIAGAAVMASLCLAGCSEGKNFVNGPEYEYRLTGKTEEYVVNTTGSSVTVDQGIVIDGVFDDPNSEGRGVLEFKQGFNGYVEELPGEFMRVLRPAIYRLEQFVHTVRSRR